MKKIAISPIIAFVLLVIMPVGAFAQTSQFNVSLGFGSQNSTEVTRLQSFLVTQGFLKVQPTGNYLSLTQSAVSAFQASQGISPTGYFGPLTRAAANKIVSGQANSVSPNPATVSIKSISSSYNSLAAVAASNDKTIAWQTSVYPATVGVNINLIKKISDSPIAYTLVRTISKDTPNDGQESWTSQLGESGSDLYVEVTCSGTYQFKQGCQFVGTPIRAN